MSVTEAPSGKVRVGGKSRAVPIRKVEMGAGIDLIPSRI